MGEEVTLAGRLRALASDVEAGASQAVAIQLREVAKEWERLDPVRDRLQELAVASRDWAHHLRGLEETEGLAPLEPEAALLAAQEALESAVEEALERWRTCSQCNVDRHVCPGCGASVRHGETACRECSPAGWVPATWADVKTGDRIRVGGQHEAEVEVALSLTWLGSGAAQVPVKLKDRGHYTMPPTGPVERWVEPEPEPAEWAADALRILERAGLGAEVISHG